MKQSITYYLTLLVIKLKGLKKNFSGEPIDYNKIRKEDVFEPKGTFFKNNSKRFKIEDSLITEIRKEHSSTKLLLFIHGGAFISGPGQHHWDTIKTIVKETEYIIWMCNYPKAPEHKISEISKNIDSIYNAALKEYKSDQITLLGDSVGGTLSIALTQRLILNQKELPNQLILISPVMDATMSHTDIDKIDLIDPVLSKQGILSAKKMCAEDTDLKNPMISPLFGSFEKFPKTTLFLATDDITYPDQKLMVENLKEATIDIQVIEGENMPHIWPLLPIMKEAKIALYKIIEVLTNT